jgi:hypothetical protein
MCFEVCGVGKIKTKLIEFSNPKFSRKARRSKPKTNCKSSQ